MNVARLIGQVILALIALVGMFVFISVGQGLVGSDQWATEQVAYLVITGIVGFGALGLLNRSRG